jgi:hypothetical protein
VAQRRAEVRARLLHAVELGCAILARLGDPEEEEAVVRRGRGERAQREVEARVRERVLERADAELALGREQRTGRSLVGAWVRAWWTILSQQSGGWPRFQSWPWRKR